jgi:hypothetical protein
MVVLKKKKKKENNNKLLQKKEEPSHYIRWVSYPLGVNHPRFTIHKIHTLLWEDSSTYDC